MIHFRFAKWQPLCNRVQWDYRNPTIVEGFLDDSLNLRPFLLLVNEMQIPISLLACKSETDGGRNNEELT